MREEHVPQLEERRQLVLLREEQREPALAVEERVDLESGDELGCVGNIFLLKREKWRELVKNNGLVGGAEVFDRGGGDQAMEHLEAEALNKGEIVVPKLLGLGENDVEWCNKLVEALGIVETMIKYDKDVENSLNALGMALDKVHFVILVFGLSTGIRIIW